MAKLKIWSVVVLSSVAIVGLAQAGAGVVPNADDNVRNLLLNAAGTRVPKPGEIRVPVPVDGVNYEVVIAKPSEPKLVHVAR